MKNINIYIIGAIVIFALLIFITFYSSNSNKNEISQVSSAISVVENSYDFGDIDIFGGKVETVYTLKNEGTEDVVITSGYTSCMCTEGIVGDLTFGMHGNSGNEVVIPAGGTETLRAIFDPLAHGPEGIGPIKRELFLETNSTATPEIKVTFSGNVTKNEE